MKKLMMLILGFSFFAIGCGGSSDVQVRVSLPAAFVDQGIVDRIVVRVTAPDITTPIIAVLPSSSFPVTVTDSVTMNVTVPIGSARLFEVFAPLVGAGPSMMAGKVTTDVSLPGAGLTFSVPVIQMQFVNFAEDALSDVLSAAINQPNITSFKIFHVSVADPICATGTVELVVDFTDTFIAPASVETHRTIIEFDTDANPVTGTTTSRIETFQSRATTRLPNAFISGTDFAIMITNGVGGTAVGALDLTGTIAPEIAITTILPTVHFDTTNKTFTVCVPDSVFSPGGLDPDGKGLVNVLSGLDLSSTGLTSGTSFQGNDILYQSDAVRYDVNLDLATIPGGP